ncbi:MAG TPA: 5-oxoprolinase subunit PxpB [Candidatus Acidoferrales bacterium]|nr:5-oxoprolinase subunit PxpB [Candidatus Acidoferrales bacterium]
MELIASSDHSLLVRFGSSIDTAAHAQTLALFRALNGLHDPRIRNLHPAYASLQVDFDPLACQHAEMEELVSGLASRPVTKGSAAGRTHEIPVCYEPEFGEDLEDVCKHTGLSRAELIAAHTAPEYIVYFLGFSPGFAYLGGLPAILAVPRLPTPRRSVPVGSVAIGGEQTGVYPIASPGGWRLIGRTPVPLFRPDNREHPMLFEPGDALRFVNIDRARYEELLHAKF